MNEATSLLEKGTVVAARYRVEGILGRGGMGTVYLATQVALRRAVALKLLNRELSGDVKFRQRFEREGLAQAALEHAHIVPIYEADESEYGLFLAMRLIRGPTLKDLILGREITPERAVQLLAPVGDALDAAHVAGLIHRDVKPQNILIGERQHPFLADFGLTKDASDPSLTTSGQFVGTLDYVAPEQIEGQGASPASDVYALTGVLYECLTGSVPYPRDSNAAVLYAHLSSPPPRLQEQRSDLPAALDDVIAGGMAKKPQDRYPSAAVLFEETQRALAGHASAAERPPAALDRPEQAGIRSPVTPTRGLPGTRPHETREQTTTAAPAGRAYARSGRSLPRVGVLAAGGALALASAGFGMSRMAASDEGSKFANSASAGTLELSFPSPWRRTTSSNPVPDIRFEDPISLSRGDGRSGPRLIAGQVRATGPSLLPDAFLKRLGDEPPRDDAVRLNGLSAYRYAGLRPRGLGGPVTVFVAPTTAGVATVACPGAGAGENDCERIAATLRLTTGEAFPLGPDRTYQKRLAAMVSKLAKDRTAGRRALRRGRTPSGQARSARGLARSYRTAMRSLSGLQVSPAVADAHRRLAGALKQTRDSYDALARSAASQSKAGYSRARRRISRAESSVEQELGALEALGYDLSA